MQNFLRGITRLLIVSLQSHCFALCAGLLMGLQVVSVGGISIGKQLS